MRLLVIEDEKRLARNLAELLRRQGYTVDVSSDGVSGYDNASTDLYDLILLDAMLPGMDGFTLLRKLRAGGHAVPVLMLTARSDLSDRVQGLDCGADYYLTKPFEPQELLACIRALTRRQPELHSLLRYEFRLCRHNGAPRAALRQFVLCPVTPVAVFDVRQHQRLHKSFDKGGFSRADRSHNTDIHAAAGSLSHILINRRCLHHNAILRMLSVALFLCAASVV